MTGITNHLETDALQVLDAAHHLHPFSDTKSLNEDGVRVITRGEGVFVYDSDGKAMLDAMSGLWCVNIGYGRKELADVAYRQMMQLPYYNTFFKTSHPPAIELSHRLAELSPDGFNHVFFANSGSEANDTNLRMVRHYWASLGKPEKHIVIGRVNGYHGSTMTGSSLGGMAGMHAQGGIIAGVSHIAQPHWWAEGGDQSPEEFGLARARLLEVEIDRLGQDNVAAFIAEPVQGAGGVIIPPTTYWPEIQRICAERDILLIVDEVITGFGRTGSWFGSETFGLKPDIITIAKGLSSGYAPIGGSLVSDRVSEVLIQKGGEFNHGYTYSGHPVCAAVALENLRIMADENIITKAGEHVAPYLQKRWAELADHPLVGDACMVGLMGALQLTPEKSTRAKFAADGGTVGLICREHCFNNGLVMRHVGDRMIIAPPLVISRDEIDQLISLAEKSLDQTYVQLKADGLLQVG